MCHIARTVELALCATATPTSKPVPPPDIVFSGNPYVGDERCSEIAANAHPHARSLVEVAWCFAASSFPFALQAGWQSAAPLQVARIELTGRHPGEQIASVALARKPGIIELGIPFPFKSGYQISCHLVRRTVQLGLFQREQLSPPLVATGFGYSPWRLGLSPNRHLWVSWWSHAAQYVFLARMLTADRWALNEEPDLLTLAAQEKAHLDIAFMALGHCQCLVSSEQRACEESKTLIDCATHELLAIPAFDRTCRDAQSLVSDHLEAWLRNHGCP